MLLNRMRNKMNKKTIKVGITGGIGSGKSFVAQILCERGYKVFDCDYYAKWLMTHDNIIINDILLNVGNDAYLTSEDKYGDVILQLNKNRLSEFIFHDKNSTINKIVHPRIAELFEKWVNEQVEDIVFIESAILFDSGFDKLVDFSVMVYANNSVRLTRIRKRDGMPEERVLERMNSQMNQDEVRNKSDFVIYNNGDDDLYLQISNLLRFLNIQKNF